MLNTYYAVAYSDVWAGSTALGQITSWTRVIAQGFHGDFLSLEVICPGKHFIGVELRDLKVFTEEILALHKCRHRYKLGLAGTH